MHLVLQVKALQAKLEAQAAKLEAQVAELAAAKTAATASVTDAQARGRADARQAAKLKDAQVTAGMKIQTLSPGLGAQHPRLPCPWGVCPCCGDAVPIPTTCRLMRRSLTGLNLVNHALQTVLLRAGGA